MKNQVKTITFLGAISVLLVVIGGSIGGSALYVFLALALLMNVGAYFFSDSIVLRMSRARVLEEQEAPALFRMVRELTERAGIPMPRVAIVPDPTPNAFATGRSPSRAVVAVTEGLMRLVDPRELRGVIAHELAHVANRDTLVASIAATGATAITYIANMLQWGALLGGGSQSSEDGEGHSAAGGLVLAFLAPIAAVMLQMGISRSREYMADEYAAKLTGDPESLASALLKLQGYGQQMVARGARPEPVTTSLSIVNPLAGGGMFRLFASHPPIEDRVRLLREMAVNPSFA